VCWHSLAAAAASKWISVPSLARWAPCKAAVALAAASVESKVQLANLEN
jgi:hypothetical protein